MHSLLKVILCFIVLALLSACENADLIVPSPSTNTSQLSANDFKLAQQIFENNCQVCHETVDTGPPFKNHLPTFTKTPNGRSYLINVTLYGLDGLITAAGNPYNSLMSNYTELSDEQIALVLNYGLTAWENNTLLADNFTLITPNEVAKEREVAKTIKEVLALRNTLELP